MIRKMMLAGVTVALTCSVAHGTDGSCSEQDLNKRLLRKCTAFCVKFDCDSVATHYTSERCVSQFDAYFQSSGGQMVPCIPRYGEMTKFHPNEILCYANWQVSSYEQCDPLFNPQIDEYEVIDDSDGVSPYEICSMNLQAQFDVCRLSMEFSALSQQCYTVYEQPCYDEFSDDNAGLEACLAAMQDDNEVCKAKVHASFYFASESPWPM